MTVLIYYMNSSSEFSLVPAWTLSCETAGLYRTICHVLSIPLLCSIPPWVHILASFATFSPLQECLSPCWSNWESSPNLAPRERTRKALQQAEGIHLLGQVGRKVFGYYIFCGEEVTEFPPLPLKVFPGSNFLECAGNKSSLVSILRSFSLPGDS